MHYRHFGNEYGTLKNTTTTTTTTTTTATKSGSTATGVRQLIKGTKSINATPCETRLPVTLEILEQTIVPPRAPDDCNINAAYLAIKFLHQGVRRCGIDDSLNSGRGAAQRAKEVGMTDGEIAGRSQKPSNCTSTLQSTQSSA